MNATSAILGGVAVVGGSGALVLGVAVVASPFNRRRTARVLGAESARADRIAEAIMRGEQDARDAVDRLALAAGCARILQRLVPAEPPAIDWWSRGIEGIDAVGVPVPDCRDALRLAACLQYCLDLAYDDLRRAGKNPEANRASVAMGAFLTSGLLDRIDGWPVLEQHRAAGIYAMAGTDDLAPLCAFCGHGRYDQTRLGCDRCATDGELTRTVPDTPKPMRTAPDPRLSVRRVADIEARAEAHLHTRTGSTS
jgi:hypothetical protein